MLASTWAARTLISYAVSMSDSFFAAANGGVGNRVLTLMIQYHWESRPETGL
jgi:hypothetical protein